MKFQKERKIEFLLHIDFINKCLCENLSDYITRIELGTHIVVRKKDKGVGNIRI